jgi:hypothetical protein
MIPDELKDYDWKEAFSFGEQEREAVKSIIALDEGCNDGEPWIIVYKRNDDKYVYLEACCDYTGWDCQAGGYSEQADSLEQLIRGRLTDDARRRLQLYKASDT